MKIQFQESLRESLSALADMAPRLLAALLAAVAIAGVAYLLRGLMRRYIRRSGRPKLFLTFGSELLYWLLILIALYSFLKTMGFSGLATSLMAGAGLSAIIFGFAFKDILENFLAGFLLLIQKPFKVGDIIQVDQFKGPVKALELRSTHIRLSDGRDIYIPNAKLIKTALTNFTKDGLLRHDFRVSIAVENSPEKARNAILDYLQALKIILQSPAPNVLVEEIGDKSIHLRVFFWINQLAGSKDTDIISRGESIRSHVMRGTIKVLSKQGFDKASDLLSLQWVGESTSHPKEPGSADKK